ncbi:MAG: class I SAM-dependent methyltransferase [Pirellulaceae bacterium]
MHCPICDLTDEHLWHTGNWWKCRSCRSVVRDSLPSEESLDGLYEESWQKPEACVAETGGTTSSLARTYALRLTRSIGRKDLRGLRILDFGAGRGEFTAALAEIGADVWAMDPYSASQLQGKGIRAVATVENLPSDLDFDGVVSLDAVEHLADCSESIKGVHKRIRRGGWIMIQTPNADGLLARKMRDQWRECKKDGHLLLFTSRSLRRVLEHCGFRGCRRLSWWIAYGDSVLSNSVHYALQLLRYDGNLRYLAWKA